jgi:hypothetical protein
VASESSSPDPETSSQPMELYSRYLLKRNTPIHVICNSTIKLDLEDGETIFLVANTTLGNNPAKLDSWLAGLRLEVFNPASQTVSKSRIKPASRKPEA